MAIADPLLRMVTNGLFKVSIKGLDTVDFTIKPQNALHSD